MLGFSVQAPEDIQNETTFPRATGHEMAEEGDIHVGDIVIPNPVIAAIGQGALCRSGQGRQHERSRVRLGGRDDARSHLLHMIEDIKEDVLLCDFPVTEAKEGNTSVRPLLPGWRDAFELS